MKVAITGVSGYLGRLLAEALEVESSVRSILGLDLVSPDFRCSKLEYQYADLCSSDFARLLRGTDVVFHLAFIVVPSNNAVFSRVEQTNVQGSIRLFQGAVAAGVPKIIYASSIAAYGAHPDNPEVLTEESPLRPNPQWYYSRTKGRVEHFLDDFERECPGPVIIRLRPCTVIGPGAPSLLKIFGRFPWMVRFQKQFKLDLCWDEDVVKAFRLALDHGQSDVFNVTGGNPLTIEAMADLFGMRTMPVRWEWILPALRLAARSGVVSRGMVEFLQTGLKFPINVSAEKAKRHLGWSPRFDTAGTLLEFARHHGFEP